ncbi:hypothetical protein HMI54_009256, partial [Coelomomyces lativittatus]
MHVLVFIAFVWILASMTTGLDTVTPTSAEEDTKWGMQKFPKENGEYLFTYQPNYVTFGPFHIDFEPSTISPCHAIQVMLAFIDAFHYGVRENSMDIETDIILRFNSLKTISSRIFQHPDVHPFLFNKLLQLPTLMILLSSHKGMFSYNHEFLYALPNFIKAQSCRCEGVTCHLLGFRQELRNMNSND